MASMYSFSTKTWNISGSSFNQLFADKSDLTFEHLSESATTNITDLEVLLWNSFLAIAVSIAAQWKSLA